MANITAVEIKGFQSHVNSVFHLGPGLNVITGPSDAGKTAIIRAVRWVSFNEPTGEAYVNQSVGEAEVKLLLENGMSITKRRRKGKTSYLVANDYGEESLYEKSEVPDEVKQLLGINKQTFGDFETALNFSFQLDAPFLISETASAGAKVLGKLAGTEAVDIAVKAVNKDTVAARNERTQANREVERINGDLLHYAEIDEAKEALDLAEMVLKQIEETYNKTENMKQLQQAYSIYSQQLVLFTEKLDKLADLPSIEEDLLNIEKAQLRYDTLLDLFVRYNSLTSNLALLASKLYLYTGLSVAADSLEVITENQDKLSLLNILFTEYRKYTEIVNKNSERLDKLTDLEAAGDSLQTLTGMLDSLQDLSILNVEFVRDARRAEMALEATKQFYGLIEAESLINETALKNESLAQLNRLDDERAIKIAYVKRAAHELTDAEEALKAAQQEQKAAWEAAGGICPLCEQPHEGGAC